MLKRILSVLLLSTFLLVGCTKSTSDNNKETSKSKNQQESNKQINKPSTITNPPATTNNSTTLSLNNEDIVYTEFLQTDSLLYFIDENNRLSVVEDVIDTPYITEDQISETFDYSVGSITSINNEIFLSNITDANALYKLNYEKREFTKIHSGNFYNISSHKNNIVFINKNKDSTLSYLDIKNSKIISISSDKCEKYLINGDYIIYQNLSDNSSLYSIKIDGTEKTKLTESSVDSFVTYKNTILNISALDNNLYIYDPSSRTNKNLSSINGTNLKKYDDKLFYISLSNSNHLYSLEIDSTLKSAEGTELVKDIVNNYFPTENGIFIEKPININKVFFLKYQ